MVPWYTEVLRWLVAISITIAAISLWAASIKWPPHEPPWVKPLLQSVALWWALWAAYRWFIVFANLRDLDATWVQSVRRGDISSIFMFFVGLSAIGIALGGRAMWTVAQARHRRMERRVNDL